ncbi:MAG: type II toxin-antitoxin system prevent-host-death family antitoxin [Peptococcaceae bacterium]|nr:type II toxin-antitoxin system prevent-host-death family antitoxin [Peptococcaceae bacterium]
MQFITVRDLRMKSGEIWRRLQEQGDMIVTSNGKPIAVLSCVNEKNVEEYLTTLRRVRAMEALNKIHERSRQLGLDKMSMEEIDAEIKAVRRSRAK